MIANVAGIAETDPEVEQNLQFTRGELRRRGEMHYGIPVGCVMLASKFVDRLRATLEAALGCKKVRFRAVDPLPHRGGDESTTATAAGGRNKKWSFVIVHLYADAALLFERMLEATAQTTTRLGLVASTQIDEMDTKSAVGDIPTPPLPPPPPVLPITSDATLLTEFVIESKAEYFSGVRPHDALWGRDLRSASSTRTPAALLSSAKDGAGTRADVLVNGGGSCGGNCFNSLGNRSNDSGVSTTATRQFTFGEVFAGIGGFRLGLERLGGNCVFASEVDVPAIETYRANFNGRCKSQSRQDATTSPTTNAATRQPAAAAAAAAVETSVEESNEKLDEAPAMKTNTMSGFTDVTSPQRRLGRVIKEGKTKHGRRAQREDEIGTGGEENDEEEDVVVGDISEYYAASLPSFDVLTAGFPCQPFSARGLQPGLSEDRGHLFLELVRLLRGKSPKAFIFENVVGLVTMTGGSRISRHQRRSCPQQSSSKVAPRCPTATPRCCTSTCKQNVMSSNGTSSLAAAAEEVEEEEEKIEEKEKEKEKAAAVKQRGGDVGHSSGGSESVPGAKSVFTPGDTFIAMLREFEECGYDVTWRVLNARHWLPQFRERVYIVGVRRDLEEATPLNWDAIIQKANTSSNNNREVSNSADDANNGDGSLSANTRNDVNNKGFFNANSMPPPSTEAWLGASSTVSDVLEPWYESSAPSECELSKEQWQVVQEQCQRKFSSSACVSHTASSAPETQQVAAVRQSPFLSVVAVRRDRGLVLSSKLPTLTSGYHRIGNYTSKFVFPEDNEECDCDAEKSDCVTRTVDNNKTLGGCYGGGGDENNDHDFVDIEGDLTSSRKIPQEQSEFHINKQKKSLCDKSKEQHNGRPQVRPRFLTVRECARAMGFPESFVIPGEEKRYPSASLIQIPSKHCGPAEGGEEKENCGQEVNETQQSKLLKKQQAVLEQQMQNIRARFYRQIGNAVCPPVIYAIGEELLNSLAM